jgi:Tol biopolymer transport system component
VGRTIQVTREPGLEIDAAISPDGKLVAYAAGPLGATKISVMQVAGGRPVSLTADLEGGHRFPQWSADGTSISFQCERRLEGWETYVIPALGGAPRRVPTPGFVTELVWSPDGARFAYPTDYDGIFLGTPDAAEARKLCDAREPSSLSWSPDGNRIAFASGNGGYLYALLNAAPSSIRIVDVASGDSVRVTEGAHLDFSPVWMPDGKSLLFVSDRGGGRDIYRVSLGPSGEPVAPPERLTTGLDVFTMASSTDGRFLSYSVIGSRQNIWFLAVPEEGSASVRAALPVTTGNQIVEGVDVSADGKWLVFDSNRSGNQDLYKMPVSGGEPVQLTTDPAMDCCASWSPDGKEVAFHAIRSGNRDIFVVSADGGAARQLTSHAAEERYPHWSPDGTQIVFQSHERGLGGLWVLSRDQAVSSGGSPRPLTSTGEGFARWSPDGRLIAFGRAEGGVAVMSPDGGEPRLLSDFGDSPRWSKDGQTLYFRTYPPYERHGIWSIPVSGGEPRLLVRFDDPLRLSHRPEWSTDGKNFYFTLTEFEADVFVIELEDSPYR